MSTRFERVRLDLEDRLSPGMVKAAASTALLNRELHSLSRDSVRTQRSVSDIDRPVSNLGRSSNTSSREVDQLSGRLRILTDVALILGPSLIPIGAVGIPAVTGLAAQLGFAATAAGTAVLAFQGIGNTLKALNAAALEPTAANLEKAQIALEGLSPEAQKFVAQLGTMIPELHKLRDVAAAGLFPGMTEGLQSLEAGLPHVQGIIAAVSEELGHIAADTGASLASSKWTDFLDFIAREAPPALAEMAQAAGNTAHAVAALWMATDPLNDDFSRWLVTATADLDRWATGLGKTQGFADFLSYVETTGPKVAGALGSIANAALQILQAAAPLGGPVLDGIKALADVIAALANSDLGTPLFSAIAALALFNRALAITAGLQKATFGGPALASLKGTAAGIRGLSADMALLNRQSALVTLPGKNFIGPLTQAQTALTRVRSTAATLGKSAALIAGVGVASSGAADKIGLTNAASLALMGTFIAPGWGTAIGGAAGLMIDATKAGKGFEDAIDRLNTSARNADFTNLNSQIADVKKHLDDIQHTTGVGDFFGDQFSKIGDALRHPLDFHPGDERVNRAKEAIANAETARTAALAAAKVDLLRHGFEATAAGAKHATQSTKDFQTSLQHLNDVLTGRSNMRDFQAAIDDFTKSVKDNGKTLDINTEKGRNNQAALDAIASSALNVAKNLQGSQRATFLDAARASFVKAAEAAGMTQKAAKALADQVLGLKNVTGRPKIVIDANGAWRVIDATAAKLERLTRGTHIINIKAQAIGKIPQVLDAQAHADGGEVMGPRFPYADKVLAMLAPGEQVITNRHGEADRFRADRAAGRIPAYADGGRVAMVAQASSGMAIDYGRLASAVAGNQLLAQRVGRDMLEAAFASALQKTPVARTPRDPSLLYGMS